LANSDAELKVRDDRNAADFAQIQVRVYLKYSGLEIYNHPRYYAKMKPIEMSDEDTGEDFTLMNMLLPKPQKSVWETY